MSLTEIRQSVLRLLSISLSGIPNNLIIDLKMNKMQFTPEQLVVEGTYAYFNTRGTYHIIFSTPGLGVISYDIK